MPGIFGTPFASGSHTIKGGISNKGTLSIRTPGNVSALIMNAAMSSVFLVLYELHFGLDQTR